ncbi:leucine-rich repeat-containing protein 15-like [Zophobas morio]|uniref:leucine-rich repeat-containing protein 15-like n=1 Tax=Zophobas morio TaxID=2755281 RepID=UPI003083105F
MGKWVFAMTSIIIFKLTLNYDVSRWCKKRTNMQGGEELLCHNASYLLFKNPNLLHNKINTLACENCSLDTLDGTTFNVSKNSIHFLSLTSSKLRTIKEYAFSKFKSLRVLNLRNNSITDLDPKSFTNLKRIAQVDLSHNNVRILINNMFEELPNLNLLNLNFNTIYYLQPDAFKGLSNLRHLSLNNNQIEKLDGFIFKHLPNLLLLYLENNNILEIDSFAFANLGSLNSLYLNNNQIRFLTQYNFKPLTNLADLQLRGNSLTEIQISAFNGLTRLKHLYLGNNRLRTVKRYGFIGLDSLRNLELMDNDFELFDLSYVESLKNLNMLWLQQNRISNLSIDFKQDPLDSLNSLGLSDNNFTVVNFKLLYEKIPNIKDIFIYNNTWKCELLVNMFEFFQEKNVSVCASVDCNVNKTRQLVEESCVSEEYEDKEDIDTDVVTGGVGTGFRISVIIVFFNLLFV